MFCKSILAALLAGIITVGARAADLTKTAPAFTLRDSNGRSIALSNYKGKIVLLNFWATWCDGCKTELPWFADFQKKYRGKGLAVIAISMDDDGWKSVKPFLKESKLNFPVVIGSGDVAKGYAIDTLPATLLIGRDGTVQWSHMGLIDRAICEGEIRKLLH